MEQIESEAKKPFSYDIIEELNGEAPEIIRPRENSKSVDCIDQVRASESTD
jgi:hypothetical protein